jgi:hypothetical protein
VVPFAVDPGRTALVIVDMENVFAADSPVAGGVINEGAPLAALHLLVDVRRMTLSSASPGFGSFYGTDLEVLLRLRGIDTIILGGINTNVFVDTTAARPRCTSSGTVAAFAAGRRGVLAVVQERGWLARWYGLASHAWGGAAGTALGSSQAQDGTGNSPGRSMCWLATGRHDDAVTVAARSDRRGQVAQGQGDQDAEKHR